MGRTTRIPEEPFLDRMGERRDPRFFVLLACWSQITLD
jgi:hypothetical protein